MIDPYRMIFINVLGSFLIFMGLFIYKFVYPKKRINLLVLLIIISALPVISIFRTGIYESGDFNIHVYRSIEFYRSISSGNIMPSWAADVNATYGLPLFIFNYTLPYYFISFFHFLGFSFINSLKILLAGSFIFSGIFMYMFAKKIFKNEIFAFTSSIFYLFAPYHLIDLHFKVVIGEVLGFTFVPLLFLLFIKIHESKQNVKPVIFAGLVFAALVASHVFIAFAAGILLITYCFFISTKKSDLKFFVKTLAALFIGAAVSVYIWSVPFFMSQYTIVQITKLIFIPVENVAWLFYSPWRMGFLFQGPAGEISNLIGYTQVFVILFLLYKLVNKKIPKTIFTPIVFWLTVFATLLFLLLPISKFIWELFPFIKAVGQHRLLVITTLPTSILAGYLVQMKKSRMFLILLVGVTIFYTILNWGQRTVIPSISDEILTKEVPLSTYKVDRHFYANSRWVDVENPYFKQIPTSRIDVINGKGTVTEVQRSLTRHMYQVNAKTNLKIVENTLYFPGWNAKINGKFIDLSPLSKGIITINLPKGIYDLEVYYEDILILRILKIISLGTLIAILGYLTIDSIKILFKKGFLFSKA